MRTLSLLFLSLAAFGVGGVMITYLDPEAIDMVGFGIFYFSLFIGLISLFLLLKLSLLQGVLLSSLSISFLLLQQLRFFTWWLGFLLVIITIVIERNFSSE